LETYVSEISNHWLRELTFEVSKCLTTDLNVNQSTEYKHNTEYISSNILKGKDVPVLCHGDVSIA